MLFLKEEEMYMLEETVNVRLGAWSLRADVGPGSLSYPVGRSGLIWETVAIVFDIYVYSVLLKIHGDWQQDTGDGRKVFLVLTVIRLGWGTRSHICRDSPKMVSPDATHKQLLRFLMLNIAGSRQKKPLSPHRWVVIQNMGGGLKFFWIDCWERGWNIEGG